MRIVLITHHDDPLDRPILPGWLNSFAQKVGVVDIHEDPSLKWRRLKMERRRSGILGLFDVLLFRVLYRFWGRKKDQEFFQQTLERFPRFRDMKMDEADIIKTRDPNSIEVRKFLEDFKPDFIIARCKFLLKESIYRKAKVGTLAFHPGICPEYRNAHGCFWAIMNNDLSRVGLTLLKIDSGIDTGPIYGYFSYPFSFPEQTHIEIQYRCLYDNLDLIQAKLKDVFEGKVSIQNVQNRSSKTWGQPRFLAFFRWWLKRKKLSKNGS